ncbi:MAG: tRNA (adenosine(37)-N6)-dimethylallyltransferase MiaA [Candidatus Omnitrophica bacterium]|nr:tRNA (adenosine(37)-N6)-dimethylallyltransferase MiaA [Candidatus Omnitrophota bacterium]
MKCDKQPLRRRQKVLFILGPTASGKTAISLDIAATCGGEIVSADSMQVYRGMDIGTDKISPAERKKIQHHMIDIRKPSQEFSAFDFREEALLCIDAIHRRGRLPIVVGGSGLYVKALLDGLTPYPSASIKIRGELRQLKKEKGLSFLYEMAQRIDPVSMEKIHPNDEKRIVRLLEVYEQIHVRPSSLGKERKPLNDLGYSYFLIGLKQNRAELYKRVNERVDAMIAKGLVEEVSSIKNMLSITTRQAVGYKEIIEYLNGDASLADAIEKVKQHSRQLVKKQFTWFRKEKRIIWIDRDTHATVHEACAAIKREIIPWLEKE